MEPKEAIRRWVFGELESGHRDGYVYNGDDSCEVVKREAMYADPNDRASLPMAMRYEARNEHGVMQTFLVTLNIEPITPDQPVEPRKRERWQPPEVGPLFPPTEA